MHTPERMKCWIGTAIFVNKRVLKLYGEHSGDGIVLTESDSNREPIPETSDEIFEPSSRWRRQPVSPACYQQQLVEGVNKSLGAPFFRRDALPFRAANFSLD